MADHLKHHKNGFSIVMNENNEELESLTGNGSRFLNGARNFVSASVTKKKCVFGLGAFAVLSILIMGTVSLLVFSAQTRGQNDQFDNQLFGLQQDFEMRISSLESQLANLQKQLENQKFSRIEGSADQISDDEELVEEKFIEKIVGKWKQVRLENMEEYLTAEGASWIFRKLALGVPPDLEIADLGNRRYEQIFTAPMYKGVFPIWLDGQNPQYKDNDKNDVIGYSKQFEDSVVIRAAGGKNGDIITTLKLQGTELHLSTTMPDKGGVTATRIFIRK